MSNFPISFDTDVELPFVNDNITEEGGDAINALRDAVFNIEQNIGLGAAGSTTSISQRLGLSLNPDGTIKPSAIASLGLVTLPITENQIAVNAGIPESKLMLDHRTQDLYNYIIDLSHNVNLANGWIAITGVKLEPHLAGAIYRHTLSQIDVATDPNLFLKNKFGGFRNNGDSYQLVNDINNEFLQHQFADGSPGGVIQPIVTQGGSSYPSNYAHLASGIFINTSRFALIPQTAQDLQLFADFIDNSSIFLLGTRIQNLYSNGISRISRSSSLTIDGYGSAVVPETPAIAYLLNTGTSSSPVDDINTGDDIIEFKPSAVAMNNNSFDAQFAQVKIGDIVRVNYGTIEVQFVIKEKKYIQGGGSKKYIIRIAGNNLFYSPNATARIDRPLFNNNKPGVLSLAAANNSFLGQPSLIVGSPRGAMALGTGFDPDLFDGTHYLLYLAIFPTGNPLDGYTILPGIDVTGNAGITPGKYTLDSIIEATNNAFRQNGYNYRFIAFSYQGEFGIMLADSYNNAGFSILNVVVSSDGSLDSLATGINFPNNVIGMFSTPPLVPPDPLGFGPSGSNVSSPPFMLAYGSPEAAQSPTKLFLPLKRNNYYINGVEKEKLNIDVFQLLDGYGDGYWMGTVQSRSVFPGAPPTGRVQTTYRILLDLSTANLKIGKTIVIQSAGEGGLVDFGRFIIQGINIGCPPNPFTDITVFDAVHGTALSPVSTLDVGGKVNIYFNSDSVSFNKESATDFTSVTPFKRHFEVYIDQQSNTFTHERGRINISGGTLTVNTVPLFSSSEIGKLNIVKISSKLRGYQFGSVNKTTLHMINFDNTTGIFTGQLTSYDGTTYSKKGPLTVGKKGEIIRFYDETNIDYIDIIYDLDTVVSTFSDLPLDIQLFPSLSIDDEIMLIGTCQLNDLTEIVNYIRDERQFGNTSEKDLSTSALNFISLPDKLLHANGVIRGFDLSDTGLNPDNGQIYLMGGVVLVNGKIIQVNNETVIIPIIKESIGATLYNIRWALCINDRGEYQTIPLLDFDTVFGTPSNTNRIFNAYNPATAASYPIDAVTFNNLIELRKDLTLLYVVSSTVDATVTPATISLSVVDARKYANDGESSFPIVLTSDTVQGNFRTLPAVLTWLKGNLTFNTHVVVRGTYNITAPQIFDFSLQQRKIIFEGDGATFNIQVDKGITLGSFIKFKNINFVYNFTTTTTSADFVNNGHGLMYAEVDAGGILTDVEIEDCVFSINTTNGLKYSYLNVNLTDSNTVVKNLKVKHNQFKIQLSTDFNAAISIINSSPQTTTVSIPKLINVSIEENICDGDQIIVLTTAKRSGIIRDAGISCVNTNIAKNVCGTIGAVTTATTGGGTSDQNNLLVIENNTCKYIANLDETGKFIEVYNISGVTTNITNNTGNVIIKNNKSAFIHYGIQSTFGTVNSLQILHNILTSNIPSGTLHTSDYLNNFNYPVNNKRYAIYVSASPGSGSLNNVLVDGNRVSGNNTGYESYIRMGATGTIINNYLENIFTAASLVNPSDFEYSAIIYDGYNSGIISKNFISRQGATAIYAYITSRFDVTSGSANFANVTENIFDSSTTNGTNEVIARDSVILSPNDLTNYWIVERNKNQIKSITLSLVDAESTLKTLPSGGFDGFDPEVEPIFEQPVNIGTSSIAPIISGGLGATTGGPNLLIIEQGLDFKNYFKYFSLDTRLPSGVTILEAKIGVWLGSGSLTTGATVSSVNTPISRFRVIVISNKKNDETNVLDVKNNTVGQNVSTVAELSINSPTANANLQSATNFVTATPSLSGPYRTGGNYSLGLVFDAFYAQDPTTPTFIFIYVSPIRIRFKW